jgi:NAD(P)-dependent dehydrogenase (short-subunit alcohol dehydrogenase family)
MKIEFNADTVALVTGASKGIGYACAAQLSACGARVAIVARSADELERASNALGKQGGAVQAFSADLADPIQAVNVVEQVERDMGPVGILVSSAGAAQRFTIDELGADALHQGMEAKYFPGVLIIDAVIKRMAQRGAGSIVNIIGQGGKRASEIHIAGGAANAALMLATVGYARAYASKGVRVNGINPGLTKTGRVAGGLEAESRATGKSTEVLLKEKEATIPMGRMAEPEEVANVAAFLASDHASYVTGAIIPMDGGVASVI